MNLKKQVAALAILSAVQFANVEQVVAAKIDDELAVVAAEQEDADVEIFNIESDNKKNAPVKVSEPSKVVEQVAEPSKVVEQVAEPSKVVEQVSEPSKAVEQVSEPSKAVEQVAEPSKAVEQVAESSKAVEQVTEPSKAVEQVAEPEKISDSETPAVGLPNPLVDYKNFDAMAEAVKFISLYIPKKSGYVVNSMSTIDNKVAEIRYGRRWEPEVSLLVRTYKRQEGEDLKDISGVHGVKWRIDMTSGTSVYIAKIDERSHVAAWSVGDYTFSAQVENLSFAAFHSLVIDELVDLSTHYFVKIAD